VPYFRVFDAVGDKIFEANGMDIVNTVKECQMPHTGPIEDLRRKLDQPASTKNGSSG
jgi:hypothetical protein